MKVIILIGIHVERTPFVNPASIQMKEALFSSIST